MLSLVGSHLNTQSVTTMIAPIQDDTGVTEPLLILPIPVKLPETSTESLQELLALLEPQLSGQALDGSLPAVNEVTSQLRQLARNAQIVQNANRVQCSIAREELDRSEEEVHASLYELQKIREEIARCQQYQPSWQGVELLPMEDLSEEMQSKLPAASTEGYENAVAVARLQHEVEEMQTREDLVAALTKERDDLIKAKKDIKNRHEAVSVHIKDLYKSANAVSSKTRDVLKNAAAPSRS